MDEVVSTITAEGGRLRALVVRRAAGGFRVEVERWREEWAPSYGLVGECWSRVRAGLTFTDTLERADQLAREELRSAEGLGE